MMDLKHPAVVRVLDPNGVDEGFCYFVMELVPGGTLREAVLGSRVATADRLALIVQVGEALAEAHGKRLIHRDIKPANILLDEQGNAKLTDFDLVGAHDTTGGTRTGALGTFVYAAPECLDRPQDATARADVFGLGMTAIFCLSGRDLSMATFRNPAATVARLDCSVPVREVLARAVAWEPAERFADAMEIVAALRDALDVSSQRVAEGAGGAAIEIALTRAELSDTTSRDRGAESSLESHSRTGDRSMNLADAIYADLRNYLYTHYPTEAAREKLAADDDIPGFFERWKNQWEQRPGYTEKAWDEALRRLAEDEEQVPAINAHSGVGTRLVQRVLSLRGFYRTDEENEHLHFVRDEDGLRFEIPEAGYLPQLLLDEIAAALEIPATHEGFQSEHDMLKDEETRQSGTDNDED
jgi:hypothetical protein